MPVGSAGDGSATAKRLRQRAEEATDYISALPEEMQLRILACLSLKHAIRTSVLSCEWCHLWEHWWQESEHPSILLHHLRPHASPKPKKLLASLVERGTDHLDRFSLLVETSTMSAQCFQRCLNCAARCTVEDLHVELWRLAGSIKLAFHFSESSVLLARLFLRDIRVSTVNYRRARPFSTLEVIRFHSVDIDDRGLRKVLELCPRLRDLGLYCCNGLRSITMKASTAPYLKILAVVECLGVIGVDITPVSTIGSFRYSGGFLPNFYLPEDASLADIYIFFSGPRSPSVPVCIKIVSSLPTTGEHVVLDKRDNFFQSMTELQLLMSEMKAADLTNIYVFLKNSRCSNLERLFLQLPTILHEPMVGSFDDVGVEPPDDDLENLKIVKIVNFSWSQIEVQLVSFLLRKASSLSTFLLVSPSLVPLEVLGIPKSDLLLLEEAVANGQIILSESDAAATSPFHSDIFA